MALNASSPLSTASHVFVEPPGTAYPDHVQAQGREHPLPGTGLVVQRYATRAGVSPYDEVAWENRLALIMGEDGRPVFEQRDVEFPQFWSQLATNVVASKYFRGPLGSPQREYSVRQLLDRVVQTITDWGQRGGYFATENDAAVFADELTHLLLHQKAAFNSPVWFNVGVEERPQASACFIIAVEDSMESILEWYHQEGIIFKGGSGSGVNLSKIRGSHEQLSSGGIASGPLSFMRAADASAGAIKSGGKTRRAAKMVVLNIDHPDIAQFIHCKAEEEKKAWALIDAGYDASLDGSAYGSVFFQNANNSVRVSDAFMHAVLNNGVWQTRYVTTGAVCQSYPARDLLHMIAAATHVCGDPGMQFDTTINDWHTCSNSGRINASNPCCVTGETLIAVADGRNAVAIQDLVGTEVPVYAHDHGTGRTTIARMWNIGIKRQNAPVYRVTLDDGTSFRATDDHPVMQRDGSYRMVRDLKPGDSLMPFHSQVLAPAKTRTKRRYYWSGRSWQPQYRAVWEYAHGPQPSGHHIHHGDFDALNDTLTNLTPLPAAEHQALHSTRMRGDNNPARRFMNAAWCQHIAEAVRGVKNGNYGRTHSEATRQLMREKSAQRWTRTEERARSGAAVQAALAQAKAEGRPVGRPAGERYERCCPVCRCNFSTPRVEQIFCSRVCRYSPLGMQMSGVKTWARNRGRALTASHRAKLSTSVRAASDPETKRRAALAGHRNTILKVARLLLDHGLSVSLDTWDAMGSQARTVGADRVPTAATVKQHFASDAELRAAAALYNHKVVSVEFCGYEDVYDGTVDTYHNFAILTSAEPSCVASALNYSGVFIHNSEFVFLDDTACNLASINLMRFLNTEGEFDVEAYRHAADILLTAQEIIVDNASYPTPAITRNSYDFRPLGLGYANLGALLMARGLSYDSDAGRAYAAAVTALMTGQAYLTSAKIAKVIGPFTGYAVNRDPMLGVIRKHRDSLQHVEQRFVPSEMMQAAADAWDDALALGMQYGYRNAQATLLAPTGTVSFMMDCDTTGVEPDIALIKYKKLVGGGMMKLVNATVPLALKRLGYPQHQIKEIVQYIDEHETIEGAPFLQEAHLPVFDCAFRPAGGTRAIHYTGHIRMMAAVQPFLSGSISKTVNMPTDATVEEIEQAYILGWQLGVKALAVYRDGCKRTQPLTTAWRNGSPRVARDLLVSAVPDQREGDRSSPQGAKPLRRRLPDERPAITHKFSIAGHEGYITVGMYEDGTPGEIFLVMAKEGSTISGLMDAFATLTSLALQYGVPLKALIDKFSHMRFEPAGFTNNKEIPIAKSVMDYIFRWLASKFLDQEDRARVGVVEAPEDGTTQPLLPGLLTNGAAKRGTVSATAPRAEERFPFRLQEDAPSCAECGALMIRNGACYKCLNCGATSGCS